MPGKSSTLRRTEFRPAVFLHNLRTIVPVVLTLLLALTGLYWMQVYLPSRAGDDLKGAALRSGTGTVTGVGSVATGYKTADPGYTLKLKEQTVQARATTPVRIGQQVLVKYRIGKSGIYYVDHIESL